MSKFLKRFGLSLLVLLVTFSVQAAPSNNSSDVFADIRCEFVMSVVVPGAFWDGGTDDEASTRASKKLSSELDQGNDLIYGYVTFSKADVLGYKFKTISIPADSVRLIRTEDRLAGRLDKYTTIKDHVDIDSIEFDIWVDRTKNYMYLARLMKDGDDIFSTDSTSKNINLNFSVKSKKKTPEGKPLFFQFSAACVNKRDSI